MYDMTIVALYIVGFTAAAVIGLVLVIEEDISRRRKPSKRKGH